MICLPDSTPLLSTMELGNEVDWRAESQLFESTLKLHERDCLLNLNQDIAYATSTSTDSAYIQTTSPFARSGTGLSQRLFSPSGHIPEEDECPSPDHAERNQSPFGWSWNYAPPITVADTDFCSCISHGVEVALSDRKQRLTDDSVAVSFRDVARDTLRHLRYDLNAVIQDRFQKQGTLPSFDFAAYSPRRFKQLRGLFNVSEEKFMESLCAQSLEPGATSGGKSMAQYWFSHDRRYILKSLTHEESRTLNALLPHYISHFKEYPNSLLGKFHGMYKITIQGSFTVRFAVMTNVFCGRPLDRMFDLKGTTEDRLVEEGDNPGSVMMKDLNFQESFCLAPETADILEETIRADTDFLNHHGLMDYSLIVGIKELPGEAEDPQPLDHLDIFHSFHGGIQGWAWEESLKQTKSVVYYLGVIDFLQIWTGWKTAAHLLKKLTIGCCHEIDTEPPRVYHDRFLRYIHSKVVKVPTFRKVYLENDFMRNRIVALEEENSELRRRLQGREQGEEADENEISVMTSTKT